MKIIVRPLPSGYYMLRGQGPCEWAQPPTWPCSDAVLRSHAFPEASESFLRAATEMAEAALSGSEDGVTPTPLTSGGNDGRRD